MLQSKFCQWTQLGVFEDVEDVQLEHFESTHFSLKNTEDAEDVEDVHRCLKTNVYPVSHSKKEEGTLQSGRVRCQETRAQPGPESKA